MKRYLIALVLGCMALTTHAQERVLRVSTDGSYPPFSETSANGEMTGFDIDIAKALCVQMKARCEIKQIAWDGLIPALNTRKIDAIIASMNATPERMKNVAFTDSYYQNPGIFVRKKGAKIEITPQGLKGKTLGVLRSSVFDRYATEKLKGQVELKRYSSQTDANLDLRSGRLDLLFADALVLEDGFLNRPEGKDYEVFGPAITDPVYFGNGISIAVRKNDKKLVEDYNAAIKAIRANGEYQKISNKYFGRDIYVMPKSAN
ncbi:MAG: ABC transporter substrate-binding protein [Rhodocyclaceae bacterium]